VYLRTDSDYFPIQH